MSTVSQWRRGGLYVALALAFLIVSLSVGAVSAAACTTTCYVNGTTGNDANDGDTPATAKQTIQAAVNQVNAGGQVIVAAGTYAESVTVNKSVTIDGDGPATTIIDPAAGNGMNITAGDVTIQDLTLQGGGHGANVTGPIANLTFDNVHFQSNTNRGLEIFSATATTNVQVLNSLFDGNTTGIRLSSATIVEGFTIDNTTFQNHPNTGSGIGFYQANDGNDGYVKDLDVTNSTFSANGFAGIYFEEGVNVTIEDNSFTGNARGILVFDFYSSPGAATGNVLVQNNTFTDNTAASVQLAIGGENGLGDDVTIHNNTFNQNVGALGANWPVIDVRMQNGFVHAPAIITDNTITFSGTYGAATAAYGIRLRGGVDEATLTGNTVDGGGVGSNGGTPPTAGLWVAPNDSFYGLLEATAVIDANHNLFNNLPYGVVVYDPVAAAYGGLPAGASLDVNRNDLSANSDYGFRSGPSTESDGTCNWWGHASGPSGEGPGSGTDVSTFVDFAPWLTSNNLDSPCLPPPAAGLYIAPNKNNGTVGGVAYNDEDIVVNTLGTDDWAMYFDGSDVGINKNLTDFTFAPDGCMLMTFNGNQNVPGVGLVKPQDLVKFCATLTGATTAGTFTMYFDGSDVGLSAGGEIIDAVEVLANGDLVISTKGTFNISQSPDPALKGQKNDLLVFHGTSYGANTAGTWELYFNNTQVSGLKKENIISLYMDPGLDKYVSFWDKYTVGAVSGDANDIVIIHPDNTVTKFWEGSDWGYTGRVHGLHIVLGP